MFKGSSRLGTEKEHRNAIFFIVRGTGGVEKWKLLPDSIGLYRDYRDPNNGESNGKENGK